MARCRWEGGNAILYFGFSVGQVLGIAFLGYLLITALVFFLDFLGRCAACGFHMFLAWLAARYAPTDSSPDDIISPADLLSSQQLSHRE